MTTVSDSIESLRTGRPEDTKRKSAISDMLAVPAERDEPSLPSPILTSRDACPVFAIGAQIGRLVAEHSRQDHLSIGAFQANDKEDGRESDALMDRAQNSLDLLRAAATYQAATSVEGALAQVVVAAGLLGEIKDNDSLDTTGRDERVNAAFRCLHSIAKALSASTGLSPRVFGSDYDMPASTDELGIAWGIRKASYVIDGPKPTIDTEGAARSSVLQRLQQYSRQTEEWTKAYFDAGRLEDQADADRAAPGAARKKQMATMVAAHAMRVRRTVLIDAIALPATTVLEFGLLARIVAAELREWWDDNNLQEGETACRHLLDKLIGQAGTFRVDDPDVAFEEVRGWIDAPFATPHCQCPADEHAGYNHELPTEA